MAIMVFQNLGPNPKLNRIKHEVKEIIKCPPPGCSVAPIDFNDLFFWRATIQGPNDSAYQGGTYELDIEFEQDFPFSPPKITFKTKIEHPYVKRSGAISVDILRQEKWLPVVNLKTLLLSIIHFLAD